MRSSMFDFKASSLQQSIYNLIDEGIHIQTNQSKRQCIKHSKDIPKDIRKEFHKQSWDITPPISPLSDQPQSEVGDVAIPPHKSALTTRGHGMLCEPRHVNTSIKHATDLSCEHLESLLNCEYSKTIVKTKKNYKHFTPNSETYLNHICDVETNTKSSHVRGENGQWTRAILRDPPKRLRVPFKWHHSWEWHQSCDSALFSFH